MNDVVRYRLITQLSTDQERRIVEFLQHSPGFSYFQSPSFFNVCQASKHLKPGYILAEEKDMLVGVLLFFRQVQTAIPILSFLSSRVIIWGGPVTSRNSDTLIAGLFQCYERQRPSSQYTQIRNLFDTNGYKSLLTQRGYIYEDHLDIIVNLDVPEADLWKAVYTKRRNQIRRAEKEGCTVQQSTSLTDLYASYAILEEVYHRAKLPLPHISHFESLYNQTDAQAGLRLFTVVCENQIIACMLCLAQGRWLFDYYAGAYSNSYKKYPNDLLPWAVFMWAKAQGMTRFDFGGAGKPHVPYGVRDYKKQFGGDLVCYGRYEKIHSGYLFQAIKTVYAGWQRIKR